MIAAMGRGNVPPEMVPGIGRYIADGKPVVITSRTGGGTSGSHIRVSGRRPDARGYGRDSRRIAQASAGAHRSDACVGRGRDRRRSARALRELITHGADAAAGNRGADNANTRETRVTKRGALAVVYATRCSASQISTGISRRARNRRRCEDSSSAPCRSASSSARSACSTKRTSCTRSRLSGLTWRPTAAMRS